MMNFVCNKQKSRIHARHAGIKNDKHSDRLRKHALKCT